MCKPMSPPASPRLVASHAKPDAVRRTTATEAMAMVSLRDKLESLSELQAFEKSRIPTIFLGSHQQTWHFDLVFKEAEYMSCNGHAYLVLRNISSNIL